MSRVIGCVGRVTAALVALGATLPGAAMAQEAGNARRAPQLFMVTAIDVSGVTRLTPAEIERLVYPYVGPRKSNDDIVAAQKALQDAYAAKGYDAVAVDIPVQPEESFRRGVILLAVKESPVGRVRVVGAEHHSLQVVRANVPSVIEGQPMNMRALERDISAANRFPDRLVTPVPRPGQVPGTIDVDLKVDDSAPYHASVELNNDNSPNTDPLRLVASARYTDLWSRGHTLTATYSVAPTARSQSEVFSGSYNAPLIGTPWTLLLYGYHSNSDVAALGGTNVLGNGDQIGVRAIFRLPSDSTFQQISFGPDYKAFQERISVLGEPLRPTPIRYMPLVAEYTIADSGDRSSYSVNAGATVGLRLFKRKNCIDLGSAQRPDQAPACTLSDGNVGVLEDQFFARSIDARENFLRFNLDVDYTHTLPGNLTLAMRFAGQIANSPLVTNEQFSIGGITNVRGYYVSEAVGDSGLIQSFELRSPEMASLLGDFADELKVFAFGDFGYARVLRVSPGQQQSFTLGGLGGGARFRLLGHFAGEFVLGVPVASGPTTRSGDPRYTFSVKGEF